MIRKIGEDGSIKLADWFLMHLYQYPLLFMNMKVWLSKISVGDLFVEFGANAVDEVLINLDYLVLLFDLLVQCLPQVLDGGWYFHFFPAHHAFALIGQLSFQIFDGCLWALHFLKQFAVLCLKSHHFGLDVGRNLDPFLFLRLQFSLDAFQLLLIFLLHNSKGVDKFFDNFECLFDRVTILVLGMLLALNFSFSPLAIKVLLQFYDLVGELLYFLLVDVREIVDVGVVELLYRFS